MKFNYKEELCL